MQIDTHSDTWITVKRETEKLLEGLRHKLETSGPDHSETQYLRGQINVCRRLLQMGEAKNDVTKPALVDKMQHDRSGI